MKIAYHIDARGPAICVKCHNLARDVPADSKASDSQHQAAFEETQRDWWNHADFIARKHGFKEAFSCGRQGGWLFTSPLPAPQGEDDIVEYPAAFVADISAWLDQAPEMYEENLANTMAQDEAEAEEKARRDALPARLALALLACLPFVDTARSLSAGDGDIAVSNALDALADYLEMLLDVESYRDLTPEEQTLVDSATAAKGDMS